MPGVKGRSGRKPLPKETKELQGTRRKDREKKNPPEPTGVAKPPAFLDAAAREEWKRIAPELQRLNLLTSVDRGAFAIHCETWGILNWCAQELKVRKNRIIESTSGRRQISPLMTLFKQMSEVYLRSAVEFGMTPSARTRIETILPSGGVGGRKDEPKDEVGNVTKIKDRRGRPT